MTTNPFPPTSRYAAVPVVTHTNPDGTEIAYLKRRFVPQPDRFTLLQYHKVAQGERLDNIAARYLDDPLQFWRLCDANRAGRPDELTETIGRKLRITMPEGIPAMGILNG